MGIVYPMEKTRKKWRSVRKHQVWFWALEYSVRHKADSKEARRFLRKIPSQFHQQIKELSKELYNVQS